MVLPGDAPLFGKGGADAFNTLVQMLVQDAAVADAFGHHARDLLDARIAIQFQRIESIGARLALGQARMNLTFGLDFNVVLLFP